MGYRHHYLAVLLYCVWGLISPSAFAQTCAPVALTCTTVGICDQGEAREEAENYCDYIRCQYSPPNWCRIQHLQDNPTLGHGRYRAARCPNAGCTSPQNSRDHAYGELCSEREVIESGVSSCSTSDSGCSTCKDGCSYDETLHLGYSSATGGWGVYRHEPNGDACTYDDGVSEDPPVDEDEPQDPPCEGTMIADLCITPYHFCADNNCVQHPPPGTCAYGDPTLCVGNPPPAPDPDTPPGPDPDPCEQGTAHANGGTFGVNVHCIDPPDEDPCESNPNLPQCDDDDDDEPPSFCEANPNHVDCETYCDNFPDALECGGDEDGDLCEENPSHPSCEGNDFCEENPQHASCQDGTFCQQNPDDPICSFCNDHPEQEICGGEGTCATNPDDPACQWCALNPDDPVCENSGNTCEDNPDHESCQGDNNDASGGGTCESAPVCTGDLILCNSLHQQWQTRCAIERLTGEGEDPEEIDGDAQDHYSETTIDSSMLNTSGFLGGGGCPAVNLTFNMLGASVTVNPLWCEILNWLGWLVVAAATVQAARIIGDV